MKCYTCNTELININDFIGSDIHMCKWCMRNTKFVAHSNAKTLYCLSDNDLTSVKKLKKLTKSGNISTKYIESELHDKIIQKYGNMDNFMREKLGINNKTLKTLNMTRKELDENEKNNRRLDLMDDLVQMNLTPNYNFKEMEDYIEKGDTSIYKKDDIIEKVKGLDFLKKHTNYNHQCRNLKSKLLYHQNTNKMDEEIYKIARKKAIEEYVKNGNDISYIPMNIIIENANSLKP